MDCLTFCVQDGGAGFGMAPARKRYTPCHCLHPEHEFPGTGSGLVTVQRIVARHGGIWAEAQEGKGASFYFSLHANRWAGPALQ